MATDRSEIWNHNTQYAEWPLILKALSNDTQDRDVLTFWPLMLK